jgi:hypothetical protein
MVVAEQVKAVLTAVIRVLVFLVDQAAVRVIALWLVLLYRVKEITAALAVVVRQQEEVAVAALEVLAQMAALQVVQAALGHLILILVLR